MKLKKAISAINKRGVLLVFPINNRKQPLSLWSEFHPRTEMRWEWDEFGDNRVGEMWSLMKKLSDCREVVYSKWYQGRATFFSKEVFTALLRMNQERLQNPAGHLSRTAMTILDILESDSPLSTKELKKLAELQGRDNERFYNRAMKELFKNFYIVAFGEVDDGAFPSLATGATKNLYEELWTAAQDMTLNEAEKILARFMPQGELFRKYLEKT